MELRPVHANISTIDFLSHLLQSFTAARKTHPFPTQPSTDVCVLVKLLSHASAKQKTKRLKGFKFCSFVGRFRVTL